MRTPITVSYALPSPSTNTVSVDSPVATSSSGATVRTSGSPMILTGNIYQDQSNKAHNNFSWNLSINGGYAPYQVSVDWRDSTVLGKQPVVFASAISLNHTFASTGYYPVNTKEPEVRTVAPE